ncbi:MAG: orotate phosphoribosyltransferase [Candidatus Diapherotrites archaeon]|nr:orotate phosphoribosyltransferase [Candidatus Diapherotrites archaeon]
MLREEKIAELLLRIGAVTVRPSKPFRYASGILSPIYTDNRLLMSYPEDRRKVARAMAKLMIEETIAPDAIPATATAGIPHAAWLAELLDKPMVYVRSEKKSHGKENVIEGIVRQGQIAVTVEDLISTGGSALGTVQALRSAGCIANNCLAIFTYEMKKAEDNFKRHKVSLHALTRFSILIDVAEKKGYISAEERRIALEWNKAPETWAKKFGFE